ncbi:MAG: hypothetical protein EXS59_02280 [Candidatus Taylorbacteria bacterium]|nr:hypothetical protein [Candidatus Taylorbacteria bacterium]
MLQIHNEAGEPVNLKAGMGLAFDQEHHLLMLFDEKPHPLGRHQIRWASGDNKKYLPFLQSEGDVTLFAHVLAQLHGLRVNEEPRRNGNLIYLFF